MTAVAWNPWIEGFLAYGTEDGKVGVFEVETGKNTQFGTHHRGTVYSLGWCPPVDGDSALCSIGADGSLYRHVAGTPTAEAYDLGA